MPAAMSRWHARMMATALMAAACAGYGGLPADARAQQVFRTPEQAMVAFGDAIASSDDAATERMLGRDARRVIPPLGADLRYRFLAAWSQHHAVQPQDDRTAHIVVGNEGWTLPIPLVRAQGGWRFDLAAGLTEMRLRRIGRNERATIETMLAVCDAQREYALQDHDGNGMLVYARKLISSPGKRDGLYWPTAEGDPPSPLGPAFLRAAGAGQRQTGYHGYRYRLLTSQGMPRPAANMVIWSMASCSAALRCWRGPCNMARPASRALWSITRARSMSATSGRRPRRVRPRSRVSTLCRGGSRYHPDGITIHGILMGVTVVPASQWLADAPPMPLCTLRCKRLRRQASARFARDKKYSYFTIGFL